MSIEDVQRFLRYHGLGPVDGFIGSAESRIDWTRPERYVVVKVTRATPNESKLVQGLGEEP